MKVLVAEDEKDIRRLVVFTLERAGYEIIEACDGREALKLATENQPNLILLDVMMPFMSGYEVCRKLRAIPELENTPIVLLSAKAQNYEIGEGLQAGATDYLIKPFIPRELAAKVKQMIG
ncbi:MAG: response regulator receiver protein [Chloroflexi bacterium]|nr:response regulator receiver protein [Chloroflexota bacterium]